MNYRDMMKCVSGACCAAVVVCGVSMVEDISGMKAGDVMLPEMQSGRITFREVLIPQFFNKYEGNLDLNAIMEVFYKIKQAGISDQRELLKLNGELIPNDDQAEFLFETLSAEENASLYSVQDQIAMRLFELGE
ncbi:MAG: hypothetical protein LBF57_04485 [Holosporaceae bacterium]|jgi:hypothetical protein|nr:hypothetical protein [Holosporaceae bacterium]